MVHSCPPPVKKRHSYHLAENVNCDLTFTSNCSCNVFTVRVFSFLWIPAFIFSQLVRARGEKEKTNFLSNVLLSKAENLQAWWVNLKCSDWILVEFFCSKNYYGK